MTISLIVAMSKDRVIGNGPDIPWHLPADFEYFKRITLGSSLIMGWNTHRSIGRVLPERKNIVLIAEAGKEPKEGAVKARNLEEAVNLAGEGEVFIIGGGQVYRSTIDRADKLYITFVEGEFEGDVFFPEIKSEEWKEISRERREADEKNPHPFEWVVFERKI